MSDALSELSSASTTLDDTLVLVRSNIVGPKETILGIAEQLDDITNQTDGFFAAAKGALHTDEIEIPVRFLWLSLSLSLSLSLFCFSSACFGLVSFGWWQCSW